jgi:hypothetical protein
MQTDFEQTKKTDDSEVNFINQWLLARFRTDALGRQIFRVVWSNELAERRDGAHEVWDGSIYLRTEFGVKQVLKYEYIKDRWILEKLVFQPNGEIVGSEIGHYEPVWVFWNKDGEYLKPILKAVQLILNCLLDGKPMTKAEWESLDKKKQEETLRLCEEFLEDTNSKLGLQFDLGEAVTVPTNYGE